MAALFLALFLAAQPAEVSVEQLDQAQPARPTTPIEQLSRGGNSAYVEGEPVDKVRPGGDVSQLSAADNEVMLGTVEGIDRCSAELLSADESAYCARRIETRSAEFRTQTSAPLSAEQKLLGERLTLRGTGVEGAARASATGSPDDQDVQALASITLANPPPQTDAAPADGQAGDLSTETQALIEAIVTKLSSPGGN